VAVRPLVFVAGGPGSFALNGALTFASVPTARAEGLQRFGDSEASSLELDCSGVTEADSAGLALLVDWHAWARRRGRSLRCAQLPERVRALAAISEVEDLLARGV
jgi:phospholipid transport system transporter-binding protein